RIVRVLVVHIVFAGIDNGQLPELRNVHGFVEHALPERALAKETNANSAIAELLGRKRGASGDGSAAADDGVGAEVSCGRIGDVHRTALTAAVALLFAEQFGKHAVGFSALGEAMTVPAVRAGDVVVRPKRFADSDGDSFFALVEVRQAGHERAQVEIVGVFLELAD